jgi:glyoxylase-like metal-dependent hydrolase (beta-lactamase superfamily II)
MSEAKRELGRGERVLPGLWRLRLPLPWPGVPHCNAWAIADGDQIVLVDCGLWLPGAGDEAGTFEQLELAMRQVGLRLEQVSKLVITHAHTDHWGQMAPVIDRSGAELWLHPNDAHGRAALDDPENTTARRIEVGRQSGIPESALVRYFEQARERPSGIAELRDADHSLVAGVQIASDLGDWEVFETPGHAPSHIMLFQRERRLLITGDHLLGRISLYFDYGWTPDPIAEFLSSLDLVDSLGGRLCVAGHGRPFNDVHAHVEGNRALVAERLALTTTALSDAPLSALDVVPGIFGAPVTPMTAAWRLTETLCFLTHLEHLGQVQRELVDGVERWRLTS